jgi:hypothetical protein
MGTQVNPLLIKIAAIAAIIVAIVGTTWFAADAHYSKQYAALKAEITQAAKDEQVSTDATNIKNNYVTKEAFNEAQTQLANAQSNLDDLNKRMSNSTGATIVSRVVSQGKDSTCKLDTVSNGPGVDTGSGSVGKVEGTVASTEVSTIDTLVLADVLQTGIDALNAELIWRGFYKQ